LSPEEKVPLTMKELGKLGGLRAADKLTPAQRSARSKPSGQTNLRKRGREYFVRLALRRWGRNVAVNPPKAEIGESPDEATCPEKG